MKPRTLSVFIGLALTCCLPASQAASVESRCLTNRPPLQPRPLLDLPLGAIRPAGWLRLQLERMRDGLTGHLDELYPQVVGPRNAWLGGDGDAWERGPYWLDGLVPLAHQLGDPQLIAKARPWIDWALTHQLPSGYLGPAPLTSDPPAEPGLQKTPREDWWPRMVMLKVLQQHYNATGDPRVPEVLLRYSRHQLAQLPRTPLDHWSFWGNRRGADNLQVVLWLYNLTGESFLLDLARLLQQQTFPYTDVFLNTNPEPSPDLSHLYPYNTDRRFPFDPAWIRRLSVPQLQSFHCVNLAQGLKTPIISSQLDPDPRHPRAVRQALADLRQFHGQPQGLFGGDEPLHGNDPTQGVELCSVVEFMFSLESMLGLTADLELADALEWIAYNALPAQTTADYRARQYFQSANQVLCTRARRNFYEEDYHGGTDTCFGLLTGYPCCTCNMHQGWPKFLQNLWYATPDRGLAALVYGPSEVQWTVGDGVPVQVREETHYPFEETVRFHLDPQRPVTFPLTLRVPAWATTVQVELNGQPLAVTPQHRLLSIRRLWRPSDQLVLHFGTRVRTSRWAENAVAVERGPLLYALRITEQWRSVAATDAFGSFLEVLPDSPWNYGLLDAAVRAPDRGFELARPDRSGAYPWTLQHAPLELRTRGKRIPDWQLYGHRAGPLPHSRPLQHLDQAPAEAITLVPYGCTRLRITEFPVVR